MSRELLPILDEAVELYIFTDDDCFELERNDSTLERFRGRIFHYLRAYELDRRLGFDACIYQIEDCPECSFAERAVPLLPSWGIVHDLTLLDDDLRRERLECLPLVSTLGEWGVTWLGNAFPKLAVSRLELPLGLSNSIHNQPELDDEAEPIIGFDGQDAQKHLCWVMLNAFCNLCISRADAGLSLPRLQWMMPHRYLVEEWSERLKHVDTKLKQYINRIEFFVAPSYLDLEIQLSKQHIAVSLNANRRCGPRLYPYLALKLGVPVVIGDYASCEEWPATSALKIKFGVGEEKALELSLAELLMQPKLREAHVQNSRKLVEDVHAPQAVLADFLGVLDSYRSLLGDKMDAHRAQIYREKGKLALSWQKKNSARAEQILGTLKA